ncbi:MAG: hypothetical protein ACT4PL_06980 [Phycisphaerales bacterium]
MFGFTRKIVRIGAIGALAAGVLVAVAGTDRAMALFSQVRGDVNGQIDQMITDPVALRHQLRELEATYPRRIAQAEADLREVKAQLGQLSRQQQESELVVEMASRDLETLQGLIAQAESAQASIVNVSLSDELPSKRIEIVFADQRLTVEQALARAAEINNARSAYSGRGTDLERDIGHLTKQEQRLSNLLGKLGSERSEFQVQLFQLDRQVDAIARNERMIEILAKRQRSIDEQSRYKSETLDHLHSKVADIRARQEGELAALAAGEDKSSYEQKAKMVLDSQSAQKAVKDAGARTSKSRKGEVIEIRALPGVKAPTTNAAEPRTTPTPVATSPVG